MYIGFVAYLTFEHGFKCLAIYTVVIFLTGSACFGV